MWVLPDTESINPGYQQLDINDQLDGGGLVPIASGQGHDAAISIQQRNAVLWGGRLQPGEHVQVPDAAFGQACWHCEPCSTPCRTTIVCGRRSTTTGS